MPERPVELGVVVEQSVVQHLLELVRRHPGAKSSEASGGGRPGRVLGVRQQRLEEENVATLGLQICQKYNN